MDSGSAHLMTILAVADMLCYLGENIFMSSNLEIYRAQESDLTSCEKKRNVMLESNNVNKE